MQNEYLGEQEFRISRYDLPNFAVKTRANKTYYLPNENRAEIEVQADYLFGKPVTKGKVRVVLEKEKRHHINDSNFVQPARTMSKIGG